MNTVRSHNSNARTETADGPLGDYPCRFRTHLETQHYSRSTVAVYARCIEALGQLMKERGLELKDLDENRALELIISRQRPLPQGTHPTFVVKRFLKFLTDLGVGKPVSPPTHAETARGTTKSICAVNGA